MVLQGCLLLVPHCGYLSPKFGREKKKKNQTSLRVLGYFAQTTCLHKWQQIAAGIEADHDYSHTSWSYLVKEPRWLNPEGRGLWKICWWSTWRIKIVVHGKMYHDTQDRTVLQCGTQKKQTRWLLKTSAQTSCATSVLWIEQTRFRFWPVRSEKEPVPENRHRALQML